MANFKSQNSSIENKIREFQSGVDYVFTGEKYHAPNKVETKGYTVRNYDINSPRLRKVLWEMLSRQVAILTSFDFVGKSYVSESLNRNNASYYCNIKDYYNGDNQKEQELVQAYQVAERRYNEKVKQNGSEPKLNIPPSGTKC
ncbi:5355_t:CDS:2 [Ambispora gerdemannii]|uniref:5355_t:CDS:1 n=1 Tax=Ambispora gerdemannii TaxID=144530 RepID=A0A9N9DYB5_9GLOM|nr:5355_t:CDS:2 [Ambispora gerdemannii]